ncbi:MAG: universal stress protein [Dehalococcoidia bacterium]
MKVMATFDGSKFAESTLPLLFEIAGLPDVEFRLVGIASEPHGRARTSRHPMPVAATVMSGAPVVVPGAPTPIAETKAQATERALTDVKEYLDEVAARFPPGARVHTEAHVGNDPGAAIVQWAMGEHPDVIVMATHGRGGLSRALFSATTEQVVRSGVAPVLLVHPEHAARRARGAQAG